MPGGIQKTQNQFIKEEKMKHTKKRAVLSAVAMLVVSAIALSSATYAWFSAGTSVGVDSISANISNNNGTILISATGAAINDGSWKIQLTEADLRAVTTNAFPTEPLKMMSAVSTTLSKGQVIGGSITDAKFSTQAAAKTNYIKYTAYLTATADCTVRITPQFTSTVAFCYGGVVQDTNTLLLNTSAGRSYYPIDSASMVDIPDGNFNDIVDPSEAAGDLGTLQTAVASGATTFLTLSMTKDLIYPFTVYVWAEGQDAACRGAITSNQSSMIINIAKQ